MRERIKLKLEKIEKERAHGERKQNRKSAAPFTLVISPNCESAIYMLIRTVVSSVSEIHEITRNE